MKFERLNPLTGAVASSAEAMQAGDMAAIAARAAAAFPAWAATGPNGRRAVLMKAAVALESRAEAFVDAMMNEIGATKGWAMFNLGLAASMIREAAALTTQISGEVIPSDKPGCLAMAVREPVRATMGIISPSTRARPQRSGGALGMRPIFGTGATCCATVAGKKKSSSPTRKTTPPCVPCIAQRLRSTRASRNCTRVRQASKDDWWLA